MSDDIADHEFDEADEEAQTPVIVLQLPKESRAAIDSLNQAIESTAQLPLEHPLRQQLSHVFSNVKFDLISAQNHAMPAVFADGFNIVFQADQPYRH